MLVGTPILNTAYPFKKHVSIRLANFTLNTTKVGFKNQLFEPQARLDVVDNTFFYATPKLWNQNISQPQASANSVDKFKNHFKK